MSSSSTIPTRAHYDYLAARTASEDDALVALREAAAEAGIPAIQIAPEQASFLQVLLKASGTREVVEVGTLFGYSALCMARALGAGGRVRTIDLEPDRVAFARAWMERNAPPATVEFHCGDGVEVLRGFETDSADALFLDADKSQYGDYLEEGLRVLRPGGLVLVDNAFAFGSLLDEAESSDSVAAVRRFNDRLAEDPRVEGIIVPLGDGIWVGVAATGEAA